MNKPDRLTVAQAYDAMFQFLSAYNARCRTDEMDSLLGDLSLNQADGKPMDPAMWGDWLAAVEKARRDSARS